MGNLRVGVVGVGYLGKFHAQKYHHMSDVDLVGVVDTGTGTAAAVDQYRVAGKTGSLRALRTGQGIALRRAFPLRKSLPFPRHSELLPALFRSTGKAF